MTRNRPGPRRPQPIQARPPHLGRWARTPVLALFFFVVGIGCATKETTGAARDAAEQVAETERIALLQSSIDRDHRTLAALVTDAPESDTRRFHANPELRRLADRLEAQRRELDSLLRAEARAAKQEAVRVEAAEAAPSETPTSPID